MPLTPTHSLAVLAAALACGAAFAQATGPSARPTPKREHAVPSEAVAVRAPLTAAELRSIDESPTLQRIRTQQKVVVAYSRSASPFSVADTDGSAKGFAIDLCTRIALAVQKQLKLPDLRIEYVSPPFSERLQAVREGKADMECGNTISNAERKQTLGFTLPVYLTVSKILVRADSDVTALSGLRGKTVVSTTGSSSEKVFRNINQRFLVGASVGTQATAADAFAQLAKGQADALFMSDIVLSDLLAKAPEPGRYRFLRDAYSVDPIAIVLAHGDTGMKLLADRELRRIMTDGDIQRLYVRWFQSSIPPANVNLNLRLNELTRDHYKRPADEVVHGNLF